MTALEDGPKPFTLLGEALVLWKRPDGTPVAMRDRCCHRTAKLSKGFVSAEGNIACGYHGWEYDCTGTCVKIPQNPTGAIPPGAAVKAYHCQEKYGYAWVSLDDPLQPIPEFPEDGAPGYRRIFQFYEEWKTSRCGSWRIPSTTHTFPSCTRPTSACSTSRNRPVTNSRNRLCFEAETRVPIRNPEASFRITGTTEPITQRHLLNRYYLPFSRRFGCMYPDSGIHHIIYNCATPIDDNRLMLVQWLYRNDSEDQCSTQELIDWDAAITAEDRDILEATDPDACVDTRRRVELHMPSDKPGLVIRRQLLGLLEAHGESEVFLSH